MNTNSNESERLVYSVRQALNASTEGIASHTADKLYAARRAALGSLRDEHASAKFLGNTIALATILPRLRVIALALALSIGATGSYYWHLFSVAEEHEEIDSLLLADDLPPAALIDRGFQQWQARASNSLSH